MQKTPRLLIAGAVAVSSVAALLIPTTPASAASHLLPLNGLASVSTSAKTGNKGSNEPSISDGGRFIAFTSPATDLVAGDTNAMMDVFVRDTLADTTTLVSVATAGTLGNNDANQPSISADGRYVAFRSFATNLVGNDTNGKGDIFVRDLVAKTTVRASLRFDSSQSDGDASDPQISDDGKLVVFQSSDDNLVSEAPSNSKDDVYLRSLANNGITERITVTSGEVGLSAGGQHPSMSGDGRYVVFDSPTTQIPGDNNGVSDVWVRDRQLGDTLLVSIPTPVAGPNDASYNGSISDDGRYVAFQSKAQNMTTDSITPGNDYLYLRDRTAGTTVMVSKSTGGAVANQSAADPQISSNGYRVAFTSTASNLVASDFNQSSDVFIRDVANGATTRVSTKTNGAESYADALRPSISGDGGYTAYQSLAIDAYTPDQNGSFDVFWRGRYQIGPFATSLAFLQQQGQDFNGRGLSTPTVVAMNDRILLGTRNPGGAIIDLAHGAFDDHRAPVIRLYWAFFERLPDQGGLDYWVKKHTNGVSIRDIATKFAQSSEFKNKYGSLSNTGFVTLVYQNVLERYPDQGGLDHWVAKLAGGTSRGEMMTFFSESNEGMRRMRAEVDTVLLYAGMLRRMPTKVEFTNAVFSLEGGTSQQPSELLAMNLVISSAYDTRIS